MGDGWGGVGLSGLTWRVSGEVVGLLLKGGYE